MCNSDAPELYNCNVCNQFDGPYQPYPPTKQQKKDWLDNFYRDLYDTHE